ncbi:MAG: hypothetical protein HFI70_04505 [Lachnospiraceae bacterium]|nr:hypothetical protein [Lachnospiraceae bacterium]
MTKKQGLRLISFLLVLGLILYGLVRVFGMPTNKDTALGVMKRYNDFYDEPENTWDCVMLGTSCVDRQWAAPLAWNEYGMAVYAMNTDVQPLYLTTCLLDEVRKTQDVKLAVVDVRGIRMDSLRPTEVRVRRVTDSMRYSANRFKTIHKAIEFYKEYYSRDDVKDGQKVLDNLDETSMYFSFLKYHSRWKEGLYESDFIRPVNDMKGIYDPADAFHSENVKPTKVIPDTAELNDLQKSVLDEIIEYGETTGLEILFTSAPSRVFEKEQPEFNGAVKYLEEKGAKVINFNTEEKYKEIGLDFSTDLYNAHHMNTKGAVKFTNYFAKYLHENYQFEDKRGKEEYKEWDEAYKRYVEFFEQGWKEK